MGIAGLTAILGGIGALFGLAYLSVAKITDNQDKRRAVTALESAARSGPAPHAKPEDRDAAVGRYLHSALSEVATMHYESNPGLRKLTAKVFANAREPRSP
jgi:hypothetical protein